MSRAKRPQPWEETGYRSIDMIASFVFYCRQQLRPLKSIYLKPSIYYKFKSDVQLHSGAELHPGQELLFDNVNIELGNLLQRDAMRPEYYPMKNVTVQN